MAYVKEVKNVIDEGLSPEVTESIYNFLTRKFESICGHVETEQFRTKISELRKHERSFYHNQIDETCEEVRDLTEEYRWFIGVDESYSIPVEINWRLVKFNEKRVKRCEGCHKYFYDSSRNGKGLTCSDECRRKYYNFTRDGGDVLHPPYKRKVQEVLYDPSPSNIDEQGHAILNDVEATVQQRYAEETRDRYIYRHY